MFKCHNRSLKSVKYKMKPDEKAFEKTLLIAKCSVCGTLILELRRVDYKGNELPAYNLRGKDAEKFFTKNRSQIVEEIEKEPTYQNKCPTWVYFDGKKSEKNVYDLNTNRKAGEFESCLQLKQA